MVSLLQGHRAYNAAEIALEFGRLAKDGVPRSKNVRSVGIPEHFFFPSINLTWGEALAMSLLTGPACRRDRPTHGGAL
jgi:hypothetical protein